MLIFGHKMLFMMLFCAAPFGLYAATEKTFWTELDEAQLQQLLKPEYLAQQRLTRLQKSATEGMRQLLPLMAEQQKKQAPRLTEQGWRFLERLEQSSFLGSSLTMKAKLTKPGQVPGKEQSP